MKNRPLLFVIIAIAHFIEPLIKILYFKVTTPFTFSTIISNIGQIQNTREMLEFWFLFPIGGLALMGVKRWSYPVFVGVQIYSLWTHLTYEKFTWPYVSEVPFASSLLLIFFNTLIIIYFALPAVRQPFFDKKIRWWETRTRYETFLPVAFSLPTQNDFFQGEILNISQTGVFIKHNKVFEQNSNITLIFKHNNTSITLLGKVSSHHAFKGKRGIGVKFEFQNIWENLLVRKIIKDIAKESKAKANLEEKNRSHLLT